MEGFVLIVLVVFFVVPPCLIVLFEKKVSWGTKIAGLIACVFLSWIGLLGYYLIRILKKHAAEA